MSGLTSVLLDQLCLQPLAMARLLGTKSYVVVDLDVVIIVMIPQIVLSACMRKSWMVPLLSITQ